MTEPRAETIERFLDALASGSPAPGGGAAAALAGAMAAALVAMVCRVSAAREREASGVGDHVAAADALRERLTALAGEDMRAYEGVLAARRAGAAMAAVDRALVCASDVPVRAAEASRDVLGLCAAVAERARASTVSDLAVAVSLAWGALESSATTARTNLAEIGDPGVAGPPGAGLDAAAAAGDAARRRAVEIIEQRQRARRR